MKKIKEIMEVKKMKVLVKIGTVYNDYFETDETYDYESESKSIGGVRKELSKEFYIYDLYQVNDNKVIALVY